MKRSVTAKSVLERLDRIDRELWDLRQSINSQSGILSAMDRALPDLKHAVYGAFKAIADWRTKNESGS